MPCTSTNTVSLTITRDASGDYSVSPDPLTIPWHGCIAFTLVDVPSAGCRLSFDKDFHGRGQSFVLTGPETDGPFETARDSWTYTIADAANPQSKKLGDTQHTIQVGSTGGQ